MRRKLLNLVVGSQLGHLYGQPACSSEEVNVNPVGVVDGFKEPHTQGRQREVSVEATLTWVLGFGRGKYLLSLVEVV